MLSETDRNREMCNQIVRQVFPDPNQADHCPVGRSVSYLITPFCYSHFRTTRLNRLRRTHDCTKTRHCFVWWFQQAWKSQGIHIEDYMLTYVGPELCSSCKISPKEFHGARYKQPYSVDLPKFEVSQEIVWYLLNNNLYSPKWRWIFAEPQSSEVNIHC